MKIVASAIAALTVMITAGAAGAAEVNVWSTSFDTQVFENYGPFPFSALLTVYGGATVTGSETLPGFGANYFRNDTAGKTIFAADGLGAHTALHLSFDLAFIDSWDSIDGSPAPDLLYVNINGLAPYVFTSNNASGSVADYGPGVRTAFGSYAQNSSWNDAIVHYDFLFAHTASDWDMAINFGGGAALRAALTRAGASTTSHLPRLCREMPFPSPRPGLS